MKTKVKSRCRQKTIEIPVFNKDGEVERKLKAIQNSIMANCYVCSCCHKNLNIFDFSRLQRSCCGSGECIQCENKKSTPTKIRVNGVIYPIIKMQIPPTKRKSVRFVE